MKDKLPTTSRADLRTLYYLTPEELNLLRTLYPKHVLPPWNLLRRRLLRAGHSPAEVGKMDPSSLLREVAKIKAGASTRTRRPARKRRAETARKAKPARP